MLHVVILMHVRKQQVWEGTLSSCYCACLFYGMQLTMMSSLQSDDKYEYTEPTKIQNLVKNYSQFVSFPIYTWQEKSRTVEVSVLCRGMHIWMISSSFSVFIGVLVVTCMDMCMSAEFIIWHVSYCFRHYFLWARERLTIFGR